LELEAEASAYRLALKPSENLWRVLLKNESLLRIARTPLILSLVTLVHKNRTADLPQGRARLYRECLEILLDIWDSKDKGLVSPDAPSPNEGLEGLVTPLLPSLTKSVSAKSLIRQIYERSGVLVEQAIGRYGFAHRALHDYLAASYIAEQNLDSILVDHAAEERWREVILIAIGLVQPKQRAETLLASLLRLSDENAASLALAGWSLAEDIQITEELRSSVRVKILHRLEYTHAPGEFSLLCSALLDTDIRALQNWIEVVLSGHNSDLQKRVLTSLTPNLGLEQSKPFLSTLIKLLADSHASTDIRTQCAVTISKLKPSMDRDDELWEALRSARRNNDIKLKFAATWAWCELGGYDDFGLVKIPAGEFLMGSFNEDKQAFDSEMPQHTLYLPDYYIAKYLVTVDEYRTFVQESQYATTDKRSLERRLSDWQNHPVVYVTWNDAFTFARWKGMTLPSEAEWEKAARGTNGRIYPWGNYWQSGLANTDEYWSTRGLSSRLPRAGFGMTTPVGFFSPDGDSPYGCADMAGNVWEWTRSVWQEYPYNGNDGRENENASRFRTLRGGSFFNYKVSARCATRSIVDSDMGVFLGQRERGAVVLFGSTGFRVAVSPVSLESF
jgi:formylglycine-generating enzyme required for sulfatase activity